jgi:hypothetical protein
MIGAIVVAKLPKGIVGGYEFDLLLIAISISLILTGPGRLSIEWNTCEGSCSPGGKEMILQQEQNKPKVRS